MSFTGISSDKSSQDIIDSLKSVLEVSLNEDRFHILLELSEKTRREDPILAENYMIQAKEFIDDSKMDQNLFDYYKTLAGVKLSQNKFEESLELCDKALLLQFDGSDNSDHFGVYEFISTAHTFMGDNVKAQEANFKALRITDSASLDNLKARIYNTIGTTYYAVNDTVMCEKYFLLALDQAKKVNEEKIITMANGNLAILYTNQKRYEEAEALILGSIERAKKSGLNTVLGSNYNNLGVIYNEQKKYKKSLDYLLKALELAKQYQTSTSITLGYMNIGEAYMELEKYKQAKESIETGLKMAKEDNNQRYYIIGLQMASEIYSSAGEYQEALDYHRLYTVLNDSMLSERRVKAVAELQEKYESEKKEREILTLSNDKASAEKREKTLYQTILLLCLGLLVAGALFYYLRQNFIKNSIIQEKNLKIASDKIQLLEKGKEIIALESLVKGQENERERLAKEMHDGLGGLLAISHSKLSNLSTAEMKTNKVLNQTRELVGEAYNQVRQISHNLMPLDLEKFGLVVAIENMVQRIKEQNDINIDFRTYDFDLLLNNELGLNIYRISQEALTNILKYAKAKNVLIELIQHNDRIALTVEDDGIGFISDVETSGIGIRNMKNRTELWDGNFTLESKVSEGTTVSVRFPLLAYKATLDQT